MKKSFTAKRTARVIANTDPSEELLDGQVLSDDGSSSTEPAVKRPSLAFKSKRKSGSRLSFGPGVSAADDEGDDVSVFKPRKSNLSRLAIEKNAERKAKASLLGDEDSLTLRPSPGNSRPSYSKEYLEELKASTPSTPKPSDEEDDESLEQEDKVLSKSLDIESKFGASALQPTAKSAIPTEAEIREKKERRARLAKEHEADHIALEDDGDVSDGSNSDSDIRRRDIALRPPDKYPETRLLPDDEDIAEGFDDFVSDGKISLGKRAEREAAKKRRTEMASMIADAEGAAGGASDDSDDVDESEEERNAAFEAVQTRSGTYSTRKESGARDRARLPAKFPPIPPLSAVVERLKSEAAAARQSREEKERRLEQLKKDREQLDERGKWIQEQLNETAARYEKLRQEAGLSAEELSLNEQSSTKFRLNGDESAMTGRGLETMGDTPVLTNTETSDDD